MEVGEEEEGLEGMAQAVLAAPERAPGSQRQMEGRCLRDSPHYWGKIPEKKNLRKEEFILVHRLRLRSIR